MLSVYLSLYPSIKFECINQSVWKLVCISWHRNQSQWPTSQIPLISLCVSLCNPLSLLGKHVPTATNIRNNRSIVGHVVLSTISVASKTICGSVYVFLILVHVQSKRWSEGPRAVGQSNIVMNSVARANRDLMYWTRFCIPLSLLLNGSVNTFPRQEDIFEASFSVRFVSSQRKIAD
jgi:hypothetical protein